MNHVIVALNAIAYIIPLVLYYKKKKQIDIGFLFYTIFAVSAIGSFWYYSLEDVDLYYPNIGIVAFVYLWIMINLCLLPLYQTDLKKITYINDRGIAPLLNVLSIMFVLLSLLPIVSLLSKISLSMFVGNDLGRMYESDADKAALYFSGISKYCFALIRRFEDILIILFFYQLSKAKKNWKLIYAMWLPIGLFVLFKVVSGSRGGVMSTFIAFFAMALFLKNTFKEKTFAYIKRVGIFFTSFIIIVVSAISISRFFFSISVQSSKATLDRWISQYLGEGMIRFNNTVWNNDLSMSGDQNLLFLKQLFGFDVIENYDAFMLFYEAKLKFPVNVFYTFIGDWVLDFGIWGTIPVAMLFYFVFKRLLTSYKSGVNVLQLTILMIIFHLIGFGFAANVYRTIFIQKDTMILIIFAVTIYLIQIMKRAKITPPYQLINIKYRLCTVISHRVIKLCAI